MSSSSSMAHISEPVELVNFVLPLTLSQYISIFWDNAEYQTIFQSQRIQQTNIKFGQWSLVPDRNIKYERVVRCIHPLPFSLPWLPVDVKVKTTQRISQGDQKDVILITESSRIKGIPYTEPYIIVDWIITAVKDKEIRCQLSLHFEYEKATFLKVQIESNTFVELTKYFKYYKNDILKKIVAIKHTNKHLLAIQPESLTALFNTTQPSSSTSGTSEEKSSIVVGYHNPLILTGDTETTTNAEQPETRKRHVSLSRESSSRRMSLSLTNHDYNYLIELISNLSKEDLDDMVEILNSPTSINYEDIFAEEFSERSMYVIFSLISFFNTIKSLEVAKWCKESFRVWSFLRMYIIVAFIYIVCLISIAYIKVFLRRKRDKSLVFDIVKISHTS